MKRKRDGHHAKTSIVDAKLGGRTFYEARVPHKRSLRLRTVVLDRHTTGVRRYGDRERVDAQFVRSAHLGRLAGEYVTRCRRYGRRREDEGDDESATRFATNADRNTLRVK